MTRDDKCMMWTAIVGSAMIIGGAILTCMFNNNAYAWIMLGSVPTVPVGFGVMVALDKLNKARKVS